LFDRFTTDNFPRAIGLPAAIHDPAFGEIVWCELHGNLVAGQDTDVVLSHLARDVRNHGMPVYKLNFKRGIGKRVDDTTFHLNGILFRHALSRD
jgi:hypothetical protein